ncbi:MAG: serine/threonine-protein kinase [Planctomycetota bacterium]|nr:serine/threonine-protein kinase [Planctomycetota bacterium]
MTKCDEVALAALLNTCDDVDEHDSDVALHVESCQHCQSRLSQLAADAEQWDAVPQWLSPDDRLSEIYAESLDARDRWKRPTAWTETMAKSLLSAASHPEMLGRIGRYDVERLIGSGGMGVVFKAYDTELNRPVAVKLLAPYLAGNGAARKRFAREARAAAAVVDDHVVPIHNVETEGEHPFLVMKYIGGGSLQQRLDREGPLEVCEVLRIGMQTAKGLAAAHAQGLIHRDVKPSNILLDEGVERALLTDFGLARAEDDACLTRSGFHPGTPHYMSPEQVRGEAIDGRSDLFGLGCVLYALCTGHPPFRAETSYAVLRRITDTEPRTIRETNADVPSWLEQIVMKLLAKSRDERFDSAADVAELLEDCLAHVQQPTTTPLPESVATLSAKQGDRPPLKKFIAAAALAVFLIFAGVLIVLELNKGTLKIECEADDVPIRIMHGENIVRSLTATKSGKTIRVAAGQYVIEVDGALNGINIQGSSVSITRGSTEVVKIQVASTTLSPDRDEHEADIHGTGEDHPHPYLVWEDEGRVRLSHWFAQAVRIDDEALESINQLLSETWAKYVELESRHTTYSRDAGHLIGVISEFSDARQRLENDFWVRLDELVSGEQRARLHAISTASGDANGDDIWAYRPTAFPYLIGWHEKRFPVRVEIWKKGRSFHWRVSERKYAASGENQNLPSQLQHFWTLGNSELDGQSATDGRAAEE